VTTNRRRFTASKVVFPHHPQNPLVVHLHSSSAQLRRNPPLAIAAPMLQGNLLNRGPHFHLFFDRSLLPQGPVKAGPADDARALIPDWPVESLFRLNVGRIVEPCGVT
jgi:hypothetical protein